MEQSLRPQKKRVASRPSYRSLTLSTLPSYLSPLPLPSHLSAHLHRLCESGDQQLQSLIDGLRTRELDVDEWQRRLWRRVTDELQPAYQHIFQVLAHITYTSP